MNTPRLYCCAHILLQVDILSQPKPFVFLFNLCFLFTKYIDHAQTPNNRTMIRKIIACAIGGFELAQ